jgi:hypothetical protein
MLYAEDNSTECVDWLWQLEYAYGHPEEMQAMAQCAKEYIFSERLSTHAAAMWQEVIESI